MGDGRTYEHLLALRSVNTSDFMTADWSRIPYEVLDRASVRIVNEVPHINRICYDITSKPPATVEEERRIKERERELEAEREKNKRKSRSRGQSS